MNAHHRPHPREVGAGNQTLIAACAHDHHITFAKRNRRRALHLQDAATLQHIVNNNGAGGGDIQAPAAPYLAQCEGVNAHVEFSEQLLKDIRCHLGLERAAVHKRHCSETVAAGRT